MCCLLLATVDKLLLNQVIVPVAAAYARASVLRGSQRACQSIKHSPAPHRPRPRTAPLAAGPESPEALKWQRARQCPAFRPPRPAHRAPRRSAPPAAGPNNQEAPMDTDKRNEINEYAEERYLSSAGVANRRYSMRERPASLQRFPS